jgi:hypothetical protein
MSSSEKWRSIISNHSKLKNDDKSLKDMNKVTQDITELITSESYVLTTVELSELISCLRVILQFWSKLVQSPANAWSRVCINVSALLTRVLAQPDSGVSDEMMLKSSKLIGFTLARLSLMGEVSGAMLHSTLVCLYNECIIYCRRAMLCCLYLVA